MPGALVFAQASVLERLALLVAQREAVRLEHRDGARHAADLVGALAVAELRVEVPRRDVLHRPGKLADRPEEPPRVQEAERADGGGQAEADDQHAPVHLVDRSEELGFRNADIEDADRLAAGILDRIVGGEKGRTEDIGLPK